MKNVSRSKKNHSHNTSIILVFAFMSLSACEAVIYQGVKAPPVVSTDPGNGDDGPIVEDPVVVINQEPVAESQSVQVSYNSTQSIQLSATDEEGDELSYVVIEAPSHGTLTGNGANRSYTPTDGYVGPDSFTFIAADGSSNSSPASVEISVSATVIIYLRENGDDSLALDPTNSSTPALTAQRAVDVAILRSPSSAHPVVIDVGERQSGNFGNVRLLQHFGEHVTWHGSNSESSVIGDVDSSGESMSDAMGSEMGLSENGADAGHGFNLSLFSNGNVRFGSVFSNGGAGGANFTGSDFDPNAYAGPSPGKGGNGGNITIGPNVKAANIYADGGMSGVDNAYVHQGLQGNGGSITIAPQAIVGNIQALGAGENFYPNYGGKAEGGHGGSVLVDGTSEMITVDGGGGYGIGGSGGSVIVNGQSSSISANGQDSYYNGGAGGDITINGLVVGTVRANGGNFAYTSGGAGGNITVNANASTGNLEANGGTIYDDMQYGATGGNGGSISYSSQASQATLDASKSANAGSGSRIDFGGIDGLPGNVEPF